VNNGPANKRPEFVLGATIVLAGSQNAIVQLQAPRTPNQQLNRSPVLAKARRLRLILQRMFARHNFTEREEERRHGASTGADVPASLACQLLPGFRAHYRLPLGMCEAMSAAIERISSRESSCPVISSWKILR
jgi:hypothetical protein